MGRKAKNGSLNNAEAFNYWLNHADFIIGDKPSKKEDETYFVKESKRLTYKEMASLRTIPAEKRCRKCGKVKPADQFCKNARNGDGLQSHCKACYKQAQQMKRKLMKETARQINKTN